MIQSARFPLWGSTAVVAVSDADRLPRALDAVQGIVDAFDRACSRFREDSELSVVNAAGGRPVSVSPLFLDAVRAGLRAAELTDGDVDPSLGCALVALGYDRDFELVRESGRAPGRVRFASVPGWGTIRIDDVAKTVAVGEGVEIDLGATAKALAADRAAQAAGTEAGTGVLVSLGGDLAIAGEPPAEGWRVRVTDDHQADLDAPGQWITLRTGGLATSSTAVRRWRAGADDVHHLLDPRTGRPAAGGWRTVSVAAASCLDANIAATAAIIRGATAPAWLESLGLPSRLVADSGNVMHLARWPTAGEDLPLLELSVTGVPA